MSAIKRVKELLFFTPGWEEMEHLDKPCPRCGRDTLYREPGKLVNVDRCRECRFEGATP